MLSIANMLASYYILEVLELNYMNRPRAEYFGYLVDALINNESLIAFSYMGNAISK